MRTIDADFSPMSFELDAPAVAPSSAPPPAYAPAPRYVRRCHRDGLELDPFGHCARCQAEREAAQARADRRGWIALAAAVMLVVGLVVGGLLWSRAEAAEDGRTAAAISQRYDRQVVVYTANGCGACNFAKTYMDEHGIAYVERRIDGDVAAYDELASLNGPIVVPTFVIGDEVQSGMDPTGVRLERALLKHGIQKRPAEAQALR